MYRMLCLLTLLMVSLTLGTGCHAHPSSKAPMPRPPVEVHIAKIKAVAQNPPGSTHVDNNMNAEPPSPAPADPTQLEEAAATCTPTGRFSAQGNKISLDRICIRLFRGPGRVSSQANWYEPTIISTTNGRLELPFRDTYLVREGQGFKLFATLTDGSTIAKRLKADHDGTFSFKGIVNQLDEVE